MVKRIGRRFVSLLLTFVTILTMLPAMTLPALAAENGSVTGLDDKTIGLSFNGDAGKDNEDPWTAGGTQITGSAQSSSGCGTTHYTSTLTITNNKSTPAKLSFDYAVTVSGGTIQVDGTSVTTNGTFSKELASGGTATVYIKSNSTDAATTITMTNISLVADLTATVTFKPAENGSYSVDGKFYTEDYTHTQSSMTAYKVVATPNKGYQFLGWYDVTNGRYINANATASLKFDSNRTITARFASETAALFETGGWQFDDLDEAGTYAQANNQKKITLASDGKITEKYTIPSGVTLLIPFDDAKTLYTNEPGYVGTAETPKAYRILTMAPGSSIEVYGAISVGGKHFAGSSGSCCKTTGRYGQIIMQEGSRITLNKGANLYAWGYITGDGEITATSGSTVYEYFQVADWRGGAAVSKLIDNGKKVFPFSQYYVQNIEAPLTIQNGATEKTYFSVSAALAGTNSIMIDFIGSNTSLFRIYDGTLTKKYDPKTDRITYTTTGKASLDSLNLSVSKFTINSGNYVLPVNNNMTLEILSGSVAVNCDAALLPGAQITIARGAKLSVSDNTSLYVYAKDQWKGPYVYASQESGFVPIPYSPTKTGKRTLADAKIDVNGTLTAAGSIYTTNSGANICSSEGGGRFVQQNAPGSSTLTHQVSKQENPISGVAYVYYDDIPITPAKLKNADGVVKPYTETNTAKAGDTFTYCKCQECGGGTWVKDVAAINDSTGTQVTTHNTLKDAVDKLKAGQYIKMLHNTTEDIKNITKDIYLDLNGRTVTGDISVTSAYKLSGMDSSAVDYTTAPTGKIVGKVTGYDPTYQTPTVKEEYDRYVAISVTENGTSTLSFHHFNISVTGYRFELATGDTPQCALFFIGKFQGDAEAKKHLTSLGITLTGDNGPQLGTYSYSIPKDKAIPKESDPGESPVVRDVDDDAFLFEAYLMRDINKENYQTTFTATARATFDNDGKQDSKPQQLSFKDAWTDPKMVITPEQKTILENFKAGLGITD